jgi:hypothetical protein
LAWPWDGSGPAGPAAMPGRTRPYLEAIGRPRHRIGCLKRGINWLSPGDHRNDGQGDCGRQNADCSKACAT